ncbi:MAG: hypothetical protein IKJ40_07690 [Bacteroidales bacterium]|nr:hypothetical protein [Bacteroidales bacterium]
MKPLFLLLLTLMAMTATAQDLSLTFTSVTDAKFFVYVNGHLYNERSSGMVTVNGLEDKDYHIRIVIDDPFEVAVTRTIKPDPKHSEYTVQFNAVRERVYLKPAATPSRRQEENNLWMPQENNQPEQQQADQPKPRPRTTVRRNNESDTATNRILNHLRTITIEEK